jgi:hypothetical protein
MPVALKVEWMMMMMMMMMMMAVARSLSKSVLELHHIGNLVV